MYFEIVIKYYSITLLHYGYVKNTSYPSQTYIGTAFTQKPYNDQPGALSSPGLNNKQISLPLFNEM